MDRNQFIAALAAPAIALGCVGLNAALAAGVGFDDRAGYTDAVKSLTADEAAAHTNAIFARADIDGSGKLDANEYAALAIVTAELSRLNGFYALDIGDGREFVPLPVSAPGALSQAEHARVDAVARAEFTPLRVKMASWIARNMSANRPRASSMRIATATACSPKPN